MGLADITRDAVEGALRELDVLGEETFFAEYGFSRAKQYWILWNGCRCPSKAIAGVAHQFLTGKQALRSSNFTGDESSVGRKLIGQSDRYEEN